MLCEGPFGVAHTRKFNSPPHRKRKRSSQPDCNRQYVKRPPNAFMIYRKEQRPHVVAETSITDCAAVNKILGQRVSEASLNGWTFLMAGKWLKAISVSWGHQLPVILVLVCAFCVYSGKWWRGKSRQNIMKRPKGKERYMQRCIQTGLPKTIMYVDKWHLYYLVIVAWIKSSKNCPVSFDKPYFFVVFIGKYAQKGSKEDW